MKNFINKTKSGFTLIEMVTSIFIIVIIASLFIANYRSSNKRTDLIMNAQKLVADIHYAQNNTLGLVRYNEIAPAGGWGLHLEKASSSYMLFADLNAPEEAGYMVYNDDEGEISYGARLSELGSNIIIYDLLVNSVSQDSVNVTFLPPDPQTNIYDGNGTSTTLDIVLQEARNDSIKTVRVNFLGLAEVID